MRAHYFDYALFGGQFVTDECRALFDERTMLQLWLDVEVALAETQAELGVIPAEAARTIAAEARIERVDFERVRRLNDETLHPLVALVRAVAERCGDAGECLHLGATTQDIWDTAEVLRLRSACDILERDLARLVAVLVELAVAHRDTPMAARTHGQAAVPITFGYKVALWLAELLRDRERLHAARARCLVGQMSGAVGTAAAFGASGQEILTRTMARLGLGTPTAPWHCARDTMAELASLFALIGGSLGRIAGEIVALQSSEVGELAEPFGDGQIGSSVMAHKRNPEISESIVVAARLLGDALPTVLAGMLQHHERDGAAWVGERVRLPEMAVICCTALHWTLHVVSGLSVRPERMRENLLRHGGLVCTEALTVRLGRSVGRKTAHGIVYRVATDAHDSNRRFDEVATDDAELARHLSREELIALLDPARQVGEALEVVDAIVTRARRALTIRGLG